MSKPTVHTAQEAIRQITEAMDQMDIDDLAQLLSQVVETNGPVIVVHDGNEGATPRNGWGGPNHRLLLCLRGRRGNWRTG